jgi:hypothetical protein
MNEDIKKFISLTEVNVSEFTLHKEVRQTTPKTKKVKPTKTKAKKTKKCKRKVCENNAVENDYLCIECCKKYEVIKTENDKIKIKKIKK